MSTTTAAADVDDGDFFSSPSYKSYALSGKIMLGAVVALLIVVILMICLHLYVRLYLLSPTRRRRRRPQFEFTTEHRIAAAQAPSRGLPQSVLKSLPVFVAKPDPDLDPSYCAVCLSEFEENEIGRIIPKCNHRFHVGCIDMWFYSHVTCPLCRSEVKPEFEPEPGSGYGYGCYNNPFEIVVEEEPGRGNSVELALSVEMDDESRDVDDVSEEAGARVTANLVKPLTIKMILCDETERDLEKEVTEAVGSER